MPPTTSGEPAYCQHINARGHRCRILPTDDSGHCAYHARHCSGHTHAGEVLAGEAPGDKAISAELLDSIDDFTSAASVNLFLGNLVKQVVRKRISRRDAVALAYLCQLLLNSLSAMNRETSLPDEKSRPLVIWDIPAPKTESANPAESTCP
jgi:hypothetical protein